MTQPFRTVRAAALALLNKDQPKGCTRKAASFLGQCALDPTPLTDPQADWLEALLRKNDLPPFGGATHE
jgi:hypothetical protein